MNLSCGLGCCGNACCLCIENSHCDGCHQCPPSSKSWCEVYQCCHRKGITGCWECIDFPCSAELFNEIRNLGFTKYIQLFSEEELIQNLLKNDRNGVLYQTLASYKGHYDEVETVEDLFSLLRDGYILPK